MHAVSRWVLSETGVSRLTAIVEPTNRDSLAVLNRCGFRVEGEMRRHLRVGEEQRTAVLMALLDTDLD